MASYRESDIVLEDGQYWVLKVPTGLDVFKVGVTHSTRCAQIGWPDDMPKAMGYARREIARRQAIDASA